MYPHSAIVELLSIIILIFPDEENEAVRRTNLPKVTESKAVTDPDAWWRSFPAP